MKLKFVVVGTGRSGTFYTAHLFSGLGIFTGHENVYNSGDSQYHGWAPQEDEIEGESSWMAVPYLDQFGGYILHQTRDPLLVVQSLLGSAFMYGHISKQSWFKNIVGKYFDLSDDHLINAVKYTLFWNQWIESFSDSPKYIRYQIEELNENRVQDLLNFMGYERSLEEIRNVLNENDNYNKKSRVAVSWEEILLTPEGKDLQIMAERYGYEGRGSSSLC